MIIIPDSNKAQGMIDSHPDTPGQEEYYEVNKIDTIEITDKELDEIGKDIGDEYWSETHTLSQYLKELIKLKIAENKSK
jgi:hypothetical protein